jgi:hypothetical protein
MRFNTQDPDAVRRWNDGISVYDDLERAIELASKAGFAGVATLIVDDERFECSQYGRDPHHLTIFGSPHELLALVASIMQVQRSTED